MVCIQKVEGENRFGTKHRRRVPTNTQELSKISKKSVFGTLAETDLDRVMTGKVDDKYLLRFRRKGTAIPGMS